ncbi:MAG: glutamate--tRNA ligase [Alphaproteobacteria bacterium]|nr:glutamate--tRNA ligase [Alphaproteobacteria bacterium]
MAGVRVRFAPSPTGRIHVGNARGALINWLFARRHGGDVLLRLDDTDRERSTEAFALGVEEDLRWLGLDWDDYARQSDRFDRYAAAAERLKAAGRLYPCYETDEENQLKRFQQVAAGGMQIYDRAALRLSDKQRRVFESEGRKPHWRFLIEYKETSWVDGVRGRQVFHGSKLSDPVLIRADGTPTYTLASVVDDTELAVTHVIRGEDHVANTAVQLQIFEALGAVESINFAHFTLLTDTGGHNLSKRLGSLSIESLRDEGLSPMSINALLARLGTADPIEPVIDLRDLVAGFDLSRFGRAAPKLDVDEIRRLNAAIVHDLPFERVRGELARLSLGGVDEAFWNAVRANLDRIADAGEWWRICREPLAPVITEPDFVAAAAGLLPPEPWSSSTWPDWTRAVGAATGRKGKALFLPLRLALTAREHGPELKTLLPILGRARAQARLRGEAA